MNNRKQQGLSGIDILVTIVFVTLILIVAVPAVDASSEESRDARTLVATIERIQGAVLRHHADTKRPALEMAAPSVDHHHNERRFHHLSKAQDYDGWAGPYLDHPVTLLDNPYGGRVHLLPGLGDAPDGGFVIGGEECNGRGQCLILGDVPESVAQRIDRHLDGEDARGWNTEGRVEYDKSTGDLYVMLMRIND